MTEFLPAALPEQRDGFPFRGGHIALDLAATLKGRKRTVKQDLIGTEAELARWLRSSGLTRDRVRVRGSDVQSAQVLREAIYALATGSGGPKERATLNEMASSLPATPRLDDDGVVRLKGDAQGLLATVAREAIFLFGGPARAHVRQCEGDGCAILFLDTSRKGTRRWCSMKACGNKAKVAQFRQRQQSKPD